MTLYANCLVLSVFSWSRVSKLVQVRMSTVGISVVAWHSCLCRPSRVARLVFSVHAISILRPACCISTPQSNSVSFYRGCRVRLFRVRSKGNIISFLKYILLRARRSAWECSPMARSLTNRTSPGGVWQRSRWFAEIRRNLLHHVLVTGAIARFGSAPKRSRVLASVRRFR